MENKVISREYVKKNYLHKDKIKEKLLKPIQEEGQKTYYYYNILKYEQN